jgi:hypothetical protein
MGKGEAMLDIELLESLLFMVTQKQAVRLNVNVSGEVRRYLISYAQDQKRAGAQCINRALLGTPALS